MVTKLTSRDKNTHGVHPKHPVFARGVTNRRLSPKFVTQEYPSAEPPKVGKDGNQHGTLCLGGLPAVEIDEFRQIRFFHCKFKYLGPLFDVNV